MKRRTEQAMKFEPCSYAPLVAVLTLNLPLLCVVSPPDTPPGADGGTVNRKIKAHQYLIAALHKWENSKKCRKIHTGRGLVIHNDTITKFEMIRINCKIIRLSHSSLKIYIIILECNTNSLARIESDWTLRDGVSYLIRGCLNRGRKILAPGKSVEGGSS